MPDAAALHPANDALNDLAVRSARILHEGMCQIVDHAPHKLTAAETLMAVLCGGMSATATLATLIVPACEDEPDAVLNMLHANLDDCWITAQRASAAGTA